ncbi:MULTISPECIES: LysR family transcriptional regulator [Neobacillus]|uniref:LysR family transcriptional regulator n=1 Tax=Neobacillus rhizophilus TaxID=2833579 RepID=A0A942UCA6_9BACI|nr:MULTISPECIES: LysR family transcriptional regulator [Neobacillus]MBS4214689.1 LysR family transcriptional regulator [Neobacillus rhizophilus]
MEIRHMRYFVSVVRNKNITRAAEELHIAQPSLSAQIKTLEQMVGCKLLERNSREISLTEAGRVLYKHACQILLQVENVYKELEEVKEVESGEIKIGIFPSATYWLPHVITELKDHYPNLNLNVLEAGAENIEKSLLNYEIHLGITSKFFHSDKLKFIPIYNEEMLLITHANHSFKNLQQVNLSELSNETFIQYKPGYQLRDIIIKSFQDAGIEPRVLCECRRLETVRSMVLSNLGVAIVPESFLEFANHRDFNITNIINPTPLRTLYVAFHKDRYFQPIIHDLKDIIIQYFENQNQAILI